MKKRQVAVSLPEELFIEIEAYQKKTYKSKNAIVVEALIALIRN